MITLFIKKCKHISQKSYNDVINRIQIHSLVCPNGHKACCTRYGHYKRTIRTEGGSVRISIARVRCSACEGTHALVLSSMVPYSQIPRDVQLKIISAYKTGHNYEPVFQLCPDLDLCTIHSIVRRFNRFWSERCLSFSLSLSDPDLLTQLCFQCFNRQFMQIRWRCNSLFLLPT